MIFSYFGVKYSKLEPVLNSNCHLLNKLLPIFLMELTNFVVND